MILEQVVNRDLGCASYIVACKESGEAVVVDPALHVAPVLTACERAGVRLIGVLETHNHADHVAGHGVLAAQHGCWIAIHRLAAPVYEHRVLDDGDRLTVGNVAIEVLHTPGHRPEHCCFAVSDLTRADEPWFVLTGDSLFVGDIARPDLAVAGEEGAAVLYHSLREGLGSLSDGVEVFPGHVSGSLCGRGMSPRTSTTLGFERRFNSMLASMPVAEFVRRANADLAPQPPNLKRIVEINCGPLLGSEPSLRAIAELDPSAAPQLLDVRDAPAFAAGHIAGSLNAPVAVNGFGTRAGFALDADREVVIVASGTAQAEQARDRLAAVGFMALAQLTGGIARVPAAERRSFAPIGLDELATGASSGHLQVLDVRDADEQLTLAPGAVAIAYRDLAAADLSRLDPARPVAVVCETGTRTPLAASMLARRGFADVRPVLGTGMSAWREPAPTA